ncbi:hypothetical protein G7062_01570 [Erysipelothrix sp. HDW6C]|uniref:hypothetical protein n=1 Tax=Erysipelothrix sp. HDW6C TaxID=2714930 RepID=UPI00140C52C5|nr:hypothetical protein [Erysipelothrix sp. HDW6C]QIK69049.1 hypothetical protein G7062_01570 [Erysipelothrix sp. HDW6C]
MNLVWQIIGLVGALAAIPLGIYMYRKKYLDIFVVAGMVVYIALFSKMDPNPFFAINSDNLLVRFVNDYLLIQLFSITITLLVVLVLIKLYRRFIKKEKE